MPTPDELPGFTVAIAGLGLMGGSLALALQGKCAALLGVDSDPAVIAQASAGGIIDRGSTRPEELLPQADLVVLAAPVEGILRLLADLPRLHPGSPVVIDLGSTKRQVMQAMQALPDRFDPLGGHPMCGKEKAGLENADSRLYEGAPFSLTRLERTSPRAAAVGWQLAQAVGARPLWLDAITHDRWTAATSHLPYLLACALANATPEETSPLVGPGFRSSTRVAGTPPSVMQDVLSTNADSVLEALARFRGELDRLETLLRSQDWPALNTELERAAAHQRALKGEPKGDLKGIPA